MAKLLFRGFETFTDIQILFIKEEIQKGVYTFVCVRIHLFGHCIPAIQNKSRDKLYMLLYDYSENYRGINTRQ